MRHHGLAGATRGRKVFTTKPDSAHVRAPDLVKRDFTATGPNKLWVTDFTYVPTWAGMVYVAFVIDVYSRMIVGWHLATTMRTDLVMTALEQAIWRRDTLLDGLISLHTPMPDRNTRPFATPIASSTSAPGPPSGRSAIPMTVSIRVLVVVRWKDCQRRCSCRSDSSYDRPWCPCFDMSTVQGQRCLTSPAEREVTL